jgi:hypothetical protein
MLSPVTELWMEKVGEEEPCGWCGRPGTVRQHEYYDGGELMCRNPSLCDVCVVFCDISGDVGDAFLEAGVDVPRTVEEPMEAALIKKWREKVQLGLRSPMTGPAERRPHSALVWLPRREDTPAQE